MHAYFCVHFFLFFAEYFPSFPLCLISLRIFAIFLFVALLLSTSFYDTFCISLVLVVALTCKIVWTLVIQFFCCCCCCRRWCCSYWWRPINECLFHTDLCFLLQIKSRCSVCYYRTKLIEFCTTLVYVVIGSHICMLLLPPPTLPLLLSCACFSCNYFQNVCSLMFARMHFDMYGQ